MITERPFCESRWKLHGSILAVLMIVTFFGGFYLLDKYEYEGEDDKYVISMLDILPTAGTINLHQISTHVLPSVVGVTDQNGKSVSSGVIVNPRGYVVTVWHAISGLTQVSVQVRTNNGIRTYLADTVRIQPEHDLVLLKLQTTDRFLFMPVLANNDQLLTDQVASFGMGTSGQIIHKPGSMGQQPVTLSVAQQQFNQLFTTSAVYTWEQSGGPLVDKRAQLVGINLAIKNNQGSSDGYVIPSRFIYLHFKDWLPGNQTEKGQKKKIIQ